MAAVKPPTRYIIVTPNDKHGDMMEHYAIYDTSMDVKICGTSNATYARFISNALNDFHGHEREAHAGTD